MSTWTLPPRACIGTGIMTSLDPNLQKLDDARPGSVSMQTEEAPSEAALGLAAPDQTDEKWVSLRFVHSGKEYTVDLADSDRYAL